MRSRELWGRRNNPNNQEDAEIKVTKGGHVKHSNNSATQHMQIYTSNDRTDKVRPFSRLSFSCMLLLLQAWAHDCLPWSNTWTVAVCMRPQLRYKLIFKVVVAAYIGLLLLNLKSKLTLVWFLVVLAKVLQSWFYPLASKFLQYLYPVKK